MSACWLRDAVEVKEAAPDIDAVPSAEPVEVFE